MTPLRSSLPFVLVLAALLSAATAASATTYVMVDDPVLATQAELIVDARVVAVEPAPVSGRPATDYTVEVERVLDGSAPGTTLIVRVPGGVRPDGIGLRIYGAPQFVAGERALLFLLPRTDGTFGILHLGLGAFHRIELAGAPPVAMRDLREATEVELPGTAADPRRHLARDFDAFAAWLEDRAAGLERAPDYFVTDAGEAMQRLGSKFTLFTQQGLNLRWFDFDTGGEVRWFAHPGGEPGMPGGGFDEFQQALAVWTREPTTPVRLTYNGTGAFNLGFTDFDDRNTLLQGDPNNEIPGAFSCFGGGGTIAIGGPWFASSQRGTFQGQQYIRILGGDVVTNDGISCLITTSSCGNNNVIGTVYTHEIGHALGIGHSCGDNESPGCGTSSRLNDAVMRAFVHRDCRPIGIRADDADALRALYGTSGGGGGGPKGPTAPAGLEGALVLSTVELAWEDRSTTENGFRVYRSANGSSFAKIAEVGTDVTKLFDDDVSPASTYRYQVTAFDQRAESAKSNTVEVVVPPAAPVGVGISLLGGANPAVGDPVELLASFSGPVERAVWDFGGGAVGFNDTPCGTGTFCRTQIFTTPGMHTAHVTIFGAFGQTAVDTLQVTVADAPFAPAEEEAFIQSVIFGRRGDTGTFESNVWLHNSGPVAGLTEVTFLPRGAEVARPPAKTVTLAPAESLFLPNVLATLFEQSAGQGSVLLRFLQEGSGASSRPGIHAISRSFVDLANRAEGSFGQLVPAQREGEWTATDKVATGIIQNDAFIATVLAANVDGRSGRVDVELFDRLGTMVGNPASFVLGANTMRFRSLPDLFPVLREQAAPGFAGLVHEGPYTARFSSNGIRFLASSTLLEVGSEDQIFIPAQQPREAAEFYLPRVVRSPGQFGVFLTTAVAVLNNAAVPTDLTFQLLLRGQNNSAPLTKTRTVGAGELLYFDDVIEELFALETATGAVRVLWNNGADVAPRLLAMTLSQNPQGDVFGMLIDSQTPADAVVGQGVGFGSEQSNLFRTQYGAVNLRTGRTDLTLTLRDGNGSAVATADLTLQARQHLEVNLVTLFGPVAETGRNWSVTTEVEGGGPVLTYFANINVSGDVFFVPGVPVFDAIEAPAR